MNDNLEMFNKPEYCRKCKGEMEFKGLGHYKCIKCGFEDLDDYGIVREYIENHKNATVGEISVMTGVSQSVINQMLREARFEVSGTSRVFLKCDGCGVEIKMGRYCPTCAKLKEAMDLQRKKKAMAESHKAQMSGVGMQQIGESGAKRFTRDR